jgi:hypothetical protein
MNEKRKTIDQMVNLNTKWVRVITVITYIISISLIGVVLGLYYMYGWSPSYEDHKKPDLHSLEMKLNRTIPIGKINVIGYEGQLEHVSYSDILYLKYIKSYGNH